MKYPVYAYRDVKVGFGQPQLFLNEMVAKRTFQIQINDPDGQLKYNPSDYELYCIGSYETDNGQFDPCVPVFMCNGIDVYGGNAK